MAAKKLQVRRDTSSNWSTANPVLDAGEFGLDMTIGKFKIGDGTTNWNHLAYYGDGEMNALEARITALENNS